MIGRTNASGGAGLNFKIVGGTTQPANPKENTIWVSADVEIAEWGFGTENPFEKDLAAGVETAQGFISADGSIDATSEYYVDYTVDFIPVDTSKKYRWAYRLSSSKTMVFRVVEYDENKNLLAVATPVNETGVSQSGSYIFANDSTKYIRLTYYGWDDPGCKVEFIENAAAEGAVWIQTGDRSTITFNSLKKNDLEVRPLLAYQYSGGAWVKRDASIHQSGAWKAFWVWDGELYDSGETFDEQTGGWKFVLEANGDARLEADHIYLGYVNYSDRGGNAWTNKPLNMANYSTLKADIEVLQALDQSYAGTWLGVAQSNSGATYESLSAGQRTVTPGRQTLTLDISSLTGNYYVALAASVTNNKIYKVWME